MMGTVWRQNYRGKARIAGGGSTDGDMDWKEVMLLQKGKSDSERVWHEELDLLVFPWQAVDVFSSVGQSLESVLSSLGSSTLYPPISYKADKKVYTKMNQMFWELSW